MPLYAVETVRMLLAQGRLVLEGGVYRPAGDLSDLAVPETLTALISARLDELDARRSGRHRRRCRPRPELQPGGAGGRLGHRRAGARAAPAGASSDASCWSSRSIPRSPERGQYAFVQALIREVAYNTLAKRDRKVRHLAAARYFESLGTDELAGALAGHYLAAQGYASDGPEADALAAQARVALRGAAERAAALGSHAQAVTFLEHALAVSPDPADRADLHERALASAMQGLVAEVAERHAPGGPRSPSRARRSRGDRPGDRRVRGCGLRSSARTRTACSRSCCPRGRSSRDLEATQAGVALMIQISSGYVHA